MVPAVRNGGSRSNRSASRAFVDRTLSPQHRANLHEFYNPSRLLSLERSVLLLVSGDFTTSPGSRFHVPLRDQCVDCFFLFSSKFRGVTDHLHTPEEDFCIIRLQMFRTGVMNVVIAVPTAKGEQRI